ncbi:hypothetical protein C8R44DRAFT_865896 [Mycena epipterygia]|nr:hypothetical protein C8R44DRAFT_865896 [Mycena epipterygia]
MRSNSGERRTEPGEPEPQVQVQVQGNARTEPKFRFGLTSPARLIESPFYSVLGPASSPVSTLDPSTVPSQTYPTSKTTFGITGLSCGRAVGDPASLSVVAVMLGKMNASYTAVCQSEVDYAVDIAPRWINGAISQRADAAELWVDFI